MTAPTVFISYSHKDEEWKDRLNECILRRAISTTGIKNEFSHLS